MLRFVRATARSIIWNVRQGFLDSVVNISQKESKANDLCLFITRRNNFLQSFKLQKFERCKIKSSTHVRQLFIVAA